MLQAIRERVRRCIARSNQQANSFSTLFLFFFFFVLSFSLLFLVHPSSLPSFLRSLVSPPQWGWSVEAPIPTIVSHLRSNHMQAVAIGAHDNVVCLTGVSNEIYEWRFTEEGEHQAETEPKQNRALRGKRLISISVGKGRCAAATAAGVLLEWGVDTKDPDAPDDVEFDPYRPREIRCLWQIAEVKCSTDHSVALTVDGKCLTWGAGGMGRLGQSSDRDYSSPTLVEALKDAQCTSIAIGPGNTGVTTKDLKAFVWGAGNSGQLGNNDIHPIFLPTQIAALQHVEITGLAFGNRHLIIVTKDGTLWATGDNGFGQLGQSVADRRLRASGARALWWGTRPDSLLCRRCPPGPLLFLLLLLLFFSCSPLPPSALPPSVVRAHRSRRFCRVEVPSSPGGEVALRYRHRRHRVRRQRHHGAVEGRPAVRVRRRGDQPDPGTPGGRPHAGTDRHAVRRRGHAGQGTSDQGDQRREHQLRGTRRQRNGLGVVRSHAHTHTRPRTSGTDKKELLSVGPFFGCVGVLTCFSLLCRSLSFTPHSPLLLSFPSPFRVPRVCQGLGVG